VAHVYDVDFGDSERTLSLLLLPHALGQNYMVAKFMTQILVKKHAP
jgi:hypothetical protein